MCLQHEIREFEPSLAGLGVAPAGVRARGIPVGSAGEAEGCTPGFSYQSGVRVAAKCKKQTGQGSASPADGHSNVLFFAVDVRDCF